VSGTTLDECRSALAARLTPESLAHSERVADVACDLAVRFGVDADAARLAGLLHDWSRDESAAELLGHAQQHALQVCDMDRAVPYLLHAAVAASQVREAFPGIAPEIVDAIASHTVGEAVMTDLMRIVYIADTIEPARSFEGVSELRAAAADPAVTLPHLYFACYQRSLLHIVGSGRRLHPDTVLAWNALVTEAGA
jgi:predicted HD superfamily hydrolase involved in NAD metabolism